MTDKLLKIENYIYNNNIQLIDYNFESDNIRAISSNNLIALNSKIKDTKEKICVLVEEIAHIKLNVGDISENSKEELKARAVAYDYLIGLDGIINSYNYGCTNKYEMAEFLDVTEEFLKEAINWYRSKYGTSILFKDYLITFIPTLSVTPIKQKLS